MFWTKNPEPMLPYLKMIDLLGFPYYFEMTITDYGKDLEPNLPTMEESMATFLLLSERIGRDRVDWRFDPIILNDVYIGDNTVIENCIVESRDTIRANSSYVGEEGKINIVVEKSDRYIL